jgi:hypothetical protein
VRRILKGGKPANLLIQQATCLEFVLNVLKVPNTLLVFADEVIE